MCGSDIGMQLSNFKLRAPFLTISQVVAFVFTLIWSIRKRNILRARNSTFAFADRNEKFCISEEDRRSRCVSDINMSIARSCALDDVVIETFGGEQSESV